MQFSDVLKTRVSTREFLERPVPEVAVRHIVDAALYAPVGMHRYETLHLSVITNREVLERVRQAVVKATGDEKADPLHGAPVLIVVSTSDTGTVGALNVSCLVENMLLAATDLGLGNLYVRGAIDVSSKDAALAREMNVPEGFTPMASVAVGYAASPTSPRETPKNNVTKVDFVG